MPWGVFGWMWLAFAWESREDGTPGERRGFVETPTFARFGALRIGHRGFVVWESGAGRV